MAQGVVVGQPRKVVAKNMYRLEIDGIPGDVRPKTLGPSKIGFKKIKTYESGRRTVADITITGYEFDAIKLTRSLTNNKDFLGWVQNQKDGKEDKRNGTLYWLDTQGQDMYRMRLRGMHIEDFQDLDGDASAMEDPMMEEISIGYIDRDERELIQ